MAMTEVSRRAFLCAVTQVSALALVSLAAGCATPGGRSGGVRKAMLAVDEAWAADNRATRATHGSRIVKATVDQAFRAARTALERIGLEVDQPASIPPAVTARKFFPEGGWSASPTVRAAEEPRFRQMMASEIGAKAANRLVIMPRAETLTGQAMLTPAASGTVRVAVDFSSSTATPCPADQACTIEVPPAALRSVYYEYWTAFGEELTEILAEDEKAAAEARRRRAAPRKTAPQPRARPKRKAKPPSGWKLPPSGWKPPS